jgi:hypothetical protein
MMRTGRVAAAIAAAFVALVPVGVTATSAGAAGTSPAGLINATMAPGSSLSPDRSFYAFQAAPGQQITQQIIVRNTGTVAAAAHVDSLDAITSDETGVDFPPNGTAPTAVGRWITVDTPALTLQGGQAQTVTFHVHVPLGTKPGVHLGGVAAYAPVAPRPNPSNVGNGQTATFNVTLQPRRIIAVEVTVPGPKAPAMVITGAHPAATPDGIALVLQMANNGNDYARGTATVSLPDTNLNQQFRINTFVPGTSINYQIPWTRDVVPGTHAVSAVLKYGGHQLNWNGTVDVNGATAAQLQAALAKARAHKSSGFPVVLVAVGLVLALLLLAAATLLRRRRRAAQLVAQPAYEDQLAA